MTNSVYYISVLTDDNWWKPLNGSASECESLEGVNGLISVAMSYCVCHGCKDFAIVEDVIDGDDVLGSRNLFVFSEDKHLLPANAGTWIALYAMKGDE